MKIVDNPHVTISYQRIVLLLCVMAGILYNSWPLGYFLDNQTARQGLASDLELVGHPFYWLFVSCDVFTGVLLATVVIILLLKHSEMFRSTSLRLILGGLFTFGLFTAVAALLPSQCTITPVLKCIVGNGRGGLGLDAITSGLAALGLFASLVCLVVAGNHKPGVLPYMTRVVVVLWTLSGLLFAVLALTNYGAHISQDILMILSGVAVAIVGLNLNDRLIALTPTRVK